MKWIRRIRRLSQRQELQALKAMADEDIDFSDIPPLPESFWLNAQRNPYYRPRKEQITLRLDSDVVAWFKSHAEVAEAIRAT